MVSVGPLVIAVLLWLDHREERPPVRVRHRAAAAPACGRRRPPRVTNPRRRAIGTSHAIVLAWVAPRRRMRRRAVSSSSFPHRHSAGGACKSFPDRRVRRGRSSEAVRRPAPWHRQVDRSRAVPAPSGRTPCPLHGRFTSAGASAGEFGCVLRWVCRAQEEDDSGPSFTRASPSLTT